MTEKKSDILLDDEFLQEFQNDNYIIERRWFLNKLSNIFCFVNNCNSSPNVKKEILNDIKLIQLKIKEKKTF